MTPTPTLSTAVADLDKTAAFEQTAPLFSVSVETLKQRPDTYKYEHTSFMYRFWGAAWDASRAAPASDIAAAPEQRFGLEVTRLVAEIRKPCSMARRDSLVEELIELIEPQAEGASAAPGSATAGAAAPEITVWYGSLPESNGKSNFTAMLMRKGASIMDGGEYIFALSEYPDRVRYEADCMRHLIGELAEQPDILDYDADKHSGYVEPKRAPAEVSPPDGVMPERMSEERMSEERIIELDCLRLTHEGDEYAVASSSVIEFARAIELEIAGQPSKQVDGAMPEPAGWLQYIDGVKTQNFARTDDELEDVKHIFRVMGGKGKVEYVPLYFAAKPAEGSALVAIPEGYALVPRKISEAMRAASRYKLGFSAMWEAAIEVGEIAAPERSDTPADLAALDRAMWSLQEFYQHDASALQAIGECRELVKSAAASKALDAAAPAGRNEVLNEAIARCEKRLHRQFPATINAVQSCIDAIKALRIDGDKEAPADPYKDVFGISGDKQGAQGDAS